jgi:hypothetical protein
MSRRTGRVFLRALGVYKGERRQTVQTGFHTQVSAHPQANGQPGYRDCNHRAHVLSLSCTRSAGRPWWNYPAVARSDDHSQMC